MARRGQTKTTPYRLRAVDRQVRALHLRASGYTFDAIARLLGWRGRQGAHLAVQTALRRLPRDDNAILVDLCVLDSLQAATMARALNGDVAAILGVLGIMARRAALLGLDSPSRIG